LNLGNDQDVTLTHYADNGILLNSTRKLYFEDGSNYDQYVGSAGSGVTAIAAPTEVDITATSIDINGAVDISGAITNGSSITSTGAVLPASSDGAALGSASLEWSDIFVADAGVLNLGDDQEVTLTHVHDTGLLLSDNDQFQFRDGDLKVYSSANGQLDIDADSEVEITAPTLDINASSEVNISNDLTVGAAINSTGAVLPASADGSALGSASKEWSDLFIADGGIVKLGDDQDVTLTHYADNGVLLNSTSKLYFDDGSNYDQYVGSAGSGVTAIVAPTEVDITAASIDINGDVEISGTTSQVGVATFTARPIFNGSVTIQDGGSIGSTSDLNAVTISSGGVVAVTATTANTIATDGALTVAGGAGIALDLTVGDDVRLLSDAAVQSFGVNSDVTLTHVHDAGLLLNSTRQLQFNDASQFIEGTSGTVLSLGATDEIDLTATAIDVNGTMDVSGAFTNGSTIVSTGVITANAGVVVDNITIDGTEIDLSSGDLTVDVAGDIILDAAGDDIILQDGGTQFGKITNASTHVTIYDGTTLNTTMSGANIEIAGTVTTTGLVIGSTAVTASAADINLIDGITNGTVIASKAIITDSNIDIAGGRNITISGELDAATLDISGAVDIAGTTNLDVVDIDSDVDIAGDLTISTASKGINTTSGSNVAHDEASSTTLTANNNRRGKYTFTTNATVADDAHSAKFTVANNTATADDIVIMNCTSNHQIEIHTFNVSSSGWDFILVNRSGSELATDTAIAFNFIVMQ